MSQEPNLTRPDFTTWMLRLAAVVAQRGSCRRLRVGAIIADVEHRIISTGYNGAPSGLPDCLEAGCDERMIDGKASCVRTLHAESNAIDYAGSRACGGQIYTTVTPCRLCALRIIQAGISHVFYTNYYESQGTFEVRALFATARIQFVQWPAP